MMRVTGVITEYNPFHNGHLYHLHQSKQITEADSIICVMNGNFMQRGAPAIIDKWARTRMALNSGVDLVIELPLTCGIRSAEFFATGAVRLLAATAVVDSFVFGSESGNLQPLQQAAKILLDEPKYFRKSLKKYINQGASYPRARLKAYSDYIQLKRKTGEAESLKALQTPNNILGVEYLKTILKYNLPLKAITIKRQQSEYHSRQKSGKIISATAIREMIREGNRLSAIKQAVPELVMDILDSEKKKGRMPVNRDLLSVLILSKLRQQSAQALTNFHGIANGLENRLWENAQQSGNLQTLLSLTKTKSFTWTRIQRCLLHLLFDLKAEDLKFLNNKPHYLRILGFTEQGEKLLSKIDKKTDLPLIIQPANYLNQIDTNSKEFLIKQLSYDLLASDIYTLLYPNPGVRIGQRDFRERVIKI